MRGAEHAGREPAAWGAVLVALVFLVALHLRPTLTSIGPLLPQIGRDEGLDEPAQGLLGSVPLLAFAVVSPLVHHLSRRIGMDRSVLLALTVLAAGVVIRSFTGTAGLWVGTVVVGSAIAVGNVLVPTLVRRDYSAHISRATGAYSACITIGAALGSAVAVPLSDRFGWHGSLASWAVPIAVVAILWLPRARSFDPGRDPPVWPASAAGTPSSIWRQPTAWRVTIFMGLQSTAFHVMVTWLPTIEITAGLSEHEAGRHLFLFQIVGIVSALAIPRLMRRPDNQIGAAITASVPMVIGVLGLLAMPQLGLLWAIVAGLGSGATLAVALTLISLRGRSEQETTRLSGMAQSLGYLLAALGPVLAGHLTQQTGSWHAALVAILALTVIQVVIAVPAGIDRRPQ